MPAAPPGRAPSAAGSGLGRLRIGTAAVGRDTHRFVVAGSHIADCHPWGRPFGSAAAHVGIDRTGLAGADCMAACLVAVCRSDRRTCGLRCARCCIVGREIGRRARP